MAVLAERSPSFAPRALEARTQEIGRELIAEARRAHAHFSVLNRWTEQVLSWCMADTAVKAAVLRFIDVLPSLHEARDVARHVRQYFPEIAARLPTALRVGASLARPGFLTAPGLALIVRQLVEHVAAQFIADARPARIRQLVHALANRGATCSLDVLGEQVLSETEADAYAAAYDGVLSEALAAVATLPAGAPLTCGPRANVSIKPSALTPRFDPIAPRASIARAARRLLPIVRRAAAGGALINIDMEQYELRDLTLELAHHVLSQCDGATQLGIVAQAYLRDTEPVIDRLLARLAAEETHLTVRLVKGAYWDAEVARAVQRSWPVPVYEEKAATDAAFERLTVRLLNAHPRVTTAIASHNVRAIACAMAVAEALGLAPQALEFQLLYGMGDAICAAIVARGYPVRIYTPIGELIPGMAYLVRRLLENTANESFLRHDLLNDTQASDLLQAPHPAGRSAPPQPSWRGAPLLDFAVGDARQGLTDALALVRAQAGVRYPVLLGDAAVDTPPLAPVVDPAAPDRVLGWVAQAGDAEVQHAVALARAAQPRWAATPVNERIALLRRAAAGLRERRALLAASEVCEVGKIWRDADADVVEAIDYLEYYTGEMERLQHGRPVAQVPGERNIYGYVPRGVAAVIAPWNFPLAIPTGMIAAALVTGNVVLFKPAEQSPLIGTQLVELLRDAGIPPPVVQCLPGTGERVGAVLVAHADVAQILFTGSRAVGLEIVRTAARCAPGQTVVKHVVAEMGGKNAVIIDADADLDAAVSGTLVSAFGYGGQKCSAASRLIVHAAIAERFLARLAAAADRLVVGDPADPDTDIGPLIEASAQQRLRQAIAGAARAGTIVYRYPEERLPQQGYFVGPAIVADLSPQHPLARDELFGPLLCVFRARTFAEALALANDTDYALTGGLYSRSPEHVGQARMAFDVGNLYINRPITGAIVGRQPFGGHRLSGLGTQAGGPDYLLQLVVPKTVSEDTRRHGMPLD